MSLFQMAARNFRQGLVLFNLRRQMALSQKNATFSTSTVVLGGDHPPSKYELHGGEKQKLPIGLEIGNREVVGYGNCGQENYVDHIHYPFPAIRFKVEITLFSQRSVHSIAHRPYLNKTGVFSKQ